MRADNFTKELFKIIDKKSKDEDNIEFFNTGRLQTSPSLTLVVGHRMTGTTTLAKDILHNLNIMDGTIINPTDTANCNYSSFVSDGINVVQNLDNDLVESIKNRQIQNSSSSPYYVIVDSVDWFGEGVFKECLESLIDERKRYNIYLLITAQTCNPFPITLIDKMDYMFINMRTLSKYTEYPLLLKNNFDCYEYLVVSTDDKLYKYRGTIKK